QLPPAVAAVVDRCLAIDPASRPQSAAALGTELERARVGGAPASSSLPKTVALPMGAPGGAWGPPPQASAFGPPPDAWASSPNDGAASGGAWGAPSQGAATGNAGGPQGSSPGDGWPPSHGAGPPGSGA